MKKALPGKILLVLLLLSVFISYSMKTGERHTKKDKQGQTNNSDIGKNIKEPADTNASVCDPDIWKYVYNPTRLKVVDKCIAVTGVIKESSADDDGDQHMLLKLDAGQEKFLKDRNLKKKKGNLVIEAVCMNTITKSKVGGACKGYINHIQLPKTGDHVKVTGSYVIDSHNGWAEIHPISKIEVIK